MTYDDAITNKELAALWWQAHNDGSEEEKTAIQAEIDRRNNNPRDPRECNPHEYSATENPSLSQCSRCLLITPTAMIVNNQPVVRTHVHLDGRKIT